MLLMCLVESDELGSNGLAGAEAVATLLDKGVAEEEAEKEDEFNERKRDEHVHLQFVDRFWLSGHALHSTVADKSEADTYAE